MKRKSLIFSLPLIIVLVSWLISYYFPDTFFRLVLEDNFFEYGQFLFLLIAAILALFVSSHLHSRLKFLAAFYFLLALGLLFIAGDEISWGQRILGIETPQELSERNVQKETTIHNIEVVMQIVGYAYLLLGFLGMFGWVLVKQLRLKRISDFIPSGLLFFYFAPNFIFNLFFIFITQEVWKWAEVTEFILYLGILIFIFLTFRKAKSLV